MPRTLMNSSYRFNTTDFTFSQYHPQTLKMRSYQKLLLPLYLLAVLLRSISMICHKATGTYNFNIQFTIYTKLITHVEGVALNTSMHQYCVISIAPPTEHRKSDFYQSVRLPTFTYMIQIHYAYVSYHMWPDAQKTHWIHTLSPTGNWSFLHISMPHTLTNSYYKFSITGFTFTQSHPQTLLHFYSSP